MKFQYLKPYKTAKGDIIRMKSLITMHGVQYVEDEDNHRHPAADLTEPTPEELRKHLQEEYDLEPMVL